ncbi:hypothetical protein MHU86_16282 [Fragilaria crotonensis]|nr:hypothetical protein MHU86_16282 [Fragilaria crotonensis]
MSFLRAVLFITIFAAITIAAFIAWVQSSTEFDGVKVMKRGATVRGHPRETLDNRSPACSFNHHRGIGLEGSKIKKIVLLHMRKAGGTSILAYLRQVAKKYGLELEAFEARPPLLPENADNQTLLVTHIREPSTRVLSHYKYEERWLCRHLTNSTFIPTLNNTRNSLNAFVETPNIVWQGIYLWECSHNCYAKWSTGLCSKEGPFNESTACWSRDDVEGSFLYRAREVLFSYNLVIVIEWLKNPEYVRSLETLFGVEGIAIPRQTEWCSNESAAANKMWPLVVPEETKQRILQLNQLDTTLYNELTSCSRFDFPNHSIFV